MGTGCLPVGVRGRERWCWWDSRAVPGGDGGGGGGERRSSAAARNAVRQRRAEQSLLPFRSVVSFGSKNRAIGVSAKNQVGSLQVAVSGEAVGPEAQVLGVHGELLGWC